MTEISAEQVRQDIASLFGVPAADVVTPMCPVGGQPPGLVIPRQALCADDDCPSMMWDPLASVEQLRANERTIDLVRDDL